MTEQDPQAQNQDPQRVVVVHERRRGLAKWVAGGLGVLAFAGLAKSCVDGGNGLDTEYGIETEKLELVEIVPVDIDLRVRSEVNIKDKAYINPQLKVKIPNPANSVPLLGRVMPDNLINYTQDLAMDVKATTEGRVRVWTGVDSSNTTVSIEGEGDEARQVVTVPAKDIIYISHIDEQLTKTTVEADRVMEFGKAEWLFLEAIGLDFGGNDRVEKFTGALERASRQHSVNVAQEECAEESWGITRDVILQKGYEMAAEKQGAYPKKVEVRVIGEEPDFTGPYRLDDKFKYSTSGGLKCTVADDAYTPVISQKSEANFLASGVRD